MSFQDYILNKHLKAKEASSLAAKEKELKKQEEYKKRQIAFEEWKNYPADKMKIESITTKFSNCGVNEYKNADEYEYLALINTEKITITSLEFDKLKAEGCPVWEREEYVEHYE